MTTHINSVAEVENWEVADGLVTITPTGGSNRFLFGAFCATNLALGIPTLAAFKYGGSAGTSMTALGAQINMGTAGVGAGRGFYAVAGPTASSDLFGDVTTIAPQRVGIGGMAYEEVDQATPYSDYTTASVDGTTGASLVCSLTVPNATDGQVVVACISVFAGSTSITPFTAVAGTTLRASAVDTDAEPATTGIVFLEKVASGAGSVTLEVTANQSTSDTWNYAAVGMRLNTASAADTLFGQALL